MLALTLFMMFGVLRLLSMNLSEVVSFVTCFKHSFHSCSDTIHHSAVIVCVLVGFFFFRQGLTV